MNDEVQPLNIFEHIELIKKEFDKIENILKNKDNDDFCIIQIETLLSLIWLVIYEINAILTACYGDDEK